MQPHSTFLSWDEHKKLSSYFEQVHHLINEGETTINDFLRLLLPSLQALHQTNDRESQDAIIKGIKGQYDQEIKGTLAKSLKGIIDQCRQLRSIIKPVIVALQEYTVRENAADQAKRRLNNLIDLQTFFQANEDKFSTIQNYISEATSDMDSVSDGEDINIVQMYIERVQRALMDCPTLFIKNKKNLISSWQKEWELLSYVAPVSFRLYMDIYCHTVSKGIASNLADVLRQALTFIVKQAMGKGVGELGGPLAGKAASSAITILSNTYKKQIDAEINNLLKDIVGDLDRSGLNPDEFYMTNDGIPSNQNTGEFIWFALNPGDQFPNPIEAEVQNYINRTIHAIGWDWDVSNNPDCLFAYQVNMNAISKTFLCDPKTNKVGAEKWVHVLTGTNDSGALYGLNMHWTLAQFPSDMPSPPPANADVI